jgi:LEA14-like dessication related protein
MIKLIDILTEITKDREIKSIEYYQQLLNMSNGLSQSTAKYFQDVINSVKKQNGKATEKQWNILQRIKTGNFNPTTKN